MKNVKFSFNLILILGLIILFATNTISFANEGGPDSFGYKWTDSLSPAPTTNYTWIEISGSGTDIGTHEDDAEYGPFNIGFTFNFYGNNHTTFYIGNNGALLFSDEDLFASNEAIPNANNPNNIIAPFWDDLYTAGDIYYETRGSAPNRYLVVQYDSINHINYEEGYISFEMILYETTNAIKFQYRDVEFKDTGYDSYDKGGKATVGIENEDGTIGVQYSCNSEDLQNNMAIAFTIDPDTTDPYVSNPNPAPGATNVLRNTNIAINVRDDGDGVDQSSIVMTVEGSNVTPTITGSPQDYTLTYSPSSLFDYGQVVNVTIDAQDLASTPNVMSTYSYSFTIEPDTTDPYVNDLNPASGATNVPRDTDIILHVRDDKTGVNQSSIIMTVEGSNVTPTITGTPQDYTLTYTPLTPFGYNQIVNVTVDAQDQASSPNVMSTFSYSFTTEDDTTDPYVNGLNPASGATGISLDTTIVLHVRDDETGVDKSSIVMTVEGSNVTPTITGTPQDYTLTYTPLTPFGYSQVVDVTVDAQDRASPPNVMSTYSYSFTIVDDTTDPYVNNLNPAPGATGISLDTNIVLHVRDAQTGVDQSSIVMTVEGSNVTPTITGTPQDYTLTYTPPTPFDYGQVVNVTVDARDLASTPNVMSTYSYSFTIGDDTTPPYVSSTTPAPDAIGVPHNTNIVIHIKDNETGVDQSSIVMTVEGSNVTPTITGTPSEYILTYDPPVDFESFQVIDVTVDAQDLANTPNVMPQYVFSFAIDTPLVNFVNPLPHPADWQGSLSVTCQVTVVSMSPIDPSNVKYKIFSAGIESPWLDDGLSVNLISGDSAHLCANIPISRFQEGPDNYIKWKCNGIQSSKYQIKIDANTPPSRPRILTPKDGSEITSFITLSWTESTDPDEYFNQITYALELAKDEKFFMSTTISNLANNNYDMKNLGDTFRDDTIYYWRVEAIDNHGTSSGYSDIASFLFNSQNLPPQITIIQPEEGVYTSRNPVIEAKITDDGNGINPDSIQITIEENPTGKVIAVIKSSDINIYDASTNTILYIYKERKLTPGNRYKLTIYAEDMAYNQPNSSSETITFKVSSFGAIADIIPYPSPFDPMKEDITFKYVLEKESRVTINLYDMSGRLVKTVIKDEEKSSGEHNEDTWDGANFADSVLANGIYFCELIVKNGDGEHRRYISFAIFGK